MMPMNAKVVKSLPVGSEVSTCDNSGAKILRIFSVKGSKTVKGRKPAAGVGDMVLASVKRGRPDILFDRRKNIEDQMVFE